MKKRKKGLLLFLVLIIGGMAAAGIYFFPAWKTARLLENSLNFTDFSYELEVELKREELDSGQVKVLEILAGLTGFEEEAMYHLTINGSVWEDKIHALIYPKGAAQPIMELYLSDTVDVINEAMLYNVIRGNLLGENALLSFLVPVQEEDMYMSLEQVEEIFGIDLSGAREFASPLKGGDFTTMKYFVGLAPMKHGKDETGESFEARGERFVLKLEVSGQGEEADFAVKFEIEEPGGILGEKAELLTRLGIELPEELSGLKNISFRMVPGEGQGFEMPEKFVSQEVIDVISKIRKFFTSEEGAGSVENHI